MSRIRIISVVGARPNFMKIGPLVAAFARRPRGRRTADSLNGGRVS